MEGMPRSLLEAQSCGLPAVGSRIPGISDVIINEENGHLIRIGDVKGFAKAIEKWYELWRSSPEAYRKLNKKVRDHIKKNYDWSIVIEMMEKMLRCVAHF